MSQFRKEIALFHESEAKILVYANMIKVMQQHIRARVEKGVSLPEQAKEVLYPDVHKDVAKLQQAYNRLDDGYKVVIKSLQNLRSDLSIHQVLGSLLCVYRWGGGTYRAMEDVMVLSSKSTVLPTPINHMLETDEKVRLAFEDDRRIDAFSNYLRTVENPWAQYAHK